MSWDELLSIYREAADEKRATDSTPPADCPNDGEPLQQGPNGVLHCRYDGFQWPRDRHLTL